MAAPENPCRGHFVPAGRLPGDVVNAFHRSITSQVLSASLAEFNKEIEPALVHIVQYLVHGAIGTEVGLNDRVECPLRSRDDWSGRYEPYPSEQSKELDQVRRIRSSDTAPQAVAGPAARPVTITMLPTPTPPTPFCASAVPSRDRSRSPAATPHSSQIAPRQRPDQPIEWHQRATLVPILPCNLPTGSSYRLYRHARR